LLILIDSNNFEIHDDDIMMIVVEYYYDVDNVNCNVDDSFDYYFDDNIDKNSMMNSMVMTRKKMKILIYKKKEFI